MTPIYTKTILLLSFMLVSSANSEETSSSNLTHQIQNSVNDILLHHEEPREEDIEGDRFPELPPDLEAKLRAHISNKNALFDQEHKEKKPRAKVSTANAPISPQTKAGDIRLHHEESREEDTEGSRFPELDPELVAILNEHTETENAIFLEKRKKDNAARAAASATANTAKILEHAKPEDRSPELDFDLETKLRAQIWSDTKHHKTTTGTKRLRGSS